MITYESNCSRCYDDDSYCVGFCPHKRFRVLTCDYCGDDVDELYNLNGDEVCEICLLKKTRIVMEGE